MEMDELRQAAQELAQQLERDHGVKAHWKANSVHIKGAGITGRLILDEEEVAVRVELSLLAAPFRTVLRREVEQHLDEYVR